MADKSERAQREEEILKFWKENKIFEKSLEKKSPKGEFVFYDGPPFATGLPHYGHILPGTIKDVIPRYKTMCGYRVPRRWGWDTHGLPIENLIEQELGLTTKKDIEKFGIAEFNKRARNSVLRLEKEWKEIIPRTGRWVDMDNAYTTMDSSYTESVWWSFKTMFDKGLVYQGFKSMHLCPRCETTLSNFEVNQGYKDITDISVYVKFELIDELRTFFLIWTTTPWTLPGNAALAVNPKELYVKARKGEENFILMKILADKVLKENYKILEEFSGEKLVGKRYKTLFDYYITESQVYGADFITTEDGTGIVHIAPAFGEDDYSLSLKEGLQFIQHVGTDGRFKIEVKDFAGRMAKPKDDHQSTDVEIIKYLAHKNLLFAKEKITHSYPHCWRCDTPLLNYASSSWFVKVTEIKDKLIAANRKVKWLPEDIRDGRFGKWLEGSRDWAVSRSRFWGTPLPVWQNSDESKKFVVDSIEILKKYVKKSGNKYFVMRHGEAMNNARHELDLTGDPDNHLTEIGKAEVKKVDVKNFDLIFSSPFLRTRETAELLGKDFAIDNRLHEVGPSEDPINVHRRMGEFIFEVDKKYQNKNVLIISHGYPIWSLFNLASKSKYNRLEQPKTGEIWLLDFAPYPHDENYELDLHRPYIDEIVLEKDGEEYRRVPEVFDTWYDSGSVPFASRKAKDFRPADFIAEGLDQTRGWFYTLIVLGTALFGASPYRQVVVNGLVLAEDGKKMSKRLKNYPELTDVLNKFGGDALRYYLVSSPAVRAEDLAFSEKGLDEVVKKNINRLENIVSFYKLYNKDENGTLISNHILDRWIDKKLEKLILDVTESLENYELDRASRPTAEFIDDLSTWYLRRSRTRPEALPKLREVLIVFSKIIAPFMPFIAEDIYQKLRKSGDLESVHLCEWPKVRTRLNLVKFLRFNLGKDIVIENMAETRRIVSLALEARAKANIKVRQPLSKLQITNDKLQKEYLEIIRDEINVKEVIVNKKLKGELLLDTNLTPELIEEGKLRDAIRNIQDWRKEKGFKPGEKVKYETNDEFLLKHKAEIERITNVELPNIHN
ncbi:MAG: class I tRNA ligase family protein [Candidatus Zambryskibacteria bacterium]|nr:class I tRNA ligase family protein [Candidatus Zambryskibacteria bacterium]